MENNPELLQKIKEADFLVSDSQCRRLIGLKYDERKMTEPKICFICFLYSDIILARQYCVIYGKKIYEDNELSAVLFNHSCVKELELKDLRKLVILYTRFLRK
ncbi:MAG: hypothetical protein J6X78_04315 [Treponema sp.]|nr:hypothetical protein [Treponema sp.]